MKSDVIEKLEQREHVLLRKSIFVGNCRTVLEPKWIIYDNKLTYKEIPYNEGYFKIINEIIDNSIDEYLKTNGKFGTKLDLTIEPDGTITVKDNGRGLSSGKDRKTGKYHVELAFCELNTGSNWQREVSIGMNGLGSALTNILSDKFKVVTSDGKYETTLDCISNCSEISLTRKKSSSRGTSVIFKIDNSRFDDIHIQTVDSIKTILYKRMVELQTVFPKIQITFNSHLIEKTIWDYLPTTCFSVTKKNIQFRAYYSPGTTAIDLSYINGLDVYKGGSHIKNFKTIFNKVIKEMISKKYKIDFNSMASIYNTFYFGFSLSNFPKPEFNTQNKTELINTDKEIKDFFELNGFDVTKLAKDFFNQYQTEINKIVETIQNSKLIDKVKKREKNNKRAKQIASFMDAVDRDRKDTVLFLVEGDSATSHFPIVRDKKKHGMFPLKGKVISAYGNTLEKILSNKEIVDLMNILGLTINKKIDGRYFDKIAILTDADVDGDHIAIMLFLFFYKYFPHLYNEKRIIKILSPLVIARKGSSIKRYYRYEEFLKDQLKLSGWKIEYNKGLGSLTEEEYSYMLNNPVYEEIVIDNNDVVSGLIEILFDKKRADDRKLWLQGKNLMEELNERR